MLRKIFSLQFVIDQLFDDEFNENWVAVWPLDYL